MGPAGVPGPSGTSTTATVLAAGADSNCPGGGTRFTTGSVVTYACTGATGPAGATGAAGATGLTGATGATGATGPAGTFSGNFNGNATIQGNLGATGTITTPGTLSAGTVTTSNLVLTGASRVKLSSLSWCGTDFASRLVNAGTLPGNYASNNTACINGTMPGTDGTAVCGAGYHPCTSWEAMVIEEMSSDSPFTEGGWVVGSFPNTEYHLRSLANGQNNTLCPGRDPAAPTSPSASYLIKYPTAFATNGITSPGGIHCVSETNSFRAWCCKNRPY